MNSKAKGARNERQSEALLEAEGYRVTKSGGSFGCFDLIGIARKRIFLIQVKTNSWPNPDEMKSIESFEAPRNAKKLIHRWNDRCKLPLIREIS
jgi:Holliday junction resolvase